MRLSAGLVGSREDASSDALTEVLDLACRRLPGVLAASLTYRMDERSKPRTMAASAAVAETLDQLQYQADAGPCLNAIASQTATITDLTTDDERWPGFSEPAVAASDARAVLSYPLTDGGHPSVSLNLYAGGIDAFDDPPPPRIVVTAALISLVLTADGQRDRADNLHAGLSTSRQIGAAVGILMHRHHWTEKQAFEALRKVSQHSNRKLYHVADEVLLTGELTPRQ